MIKAIPVILALALAPAPAEIRTASGFQKVSDHFYYIETGPGAANTAAVITPEGILLIDPPPEAEIQAVLGALKAISPRPVRWVVCTDYRRFQSAGLPTLQGLGAAVIASDDLDRLAGLAPAPEYDPGTPFPPAVIIVRQQPNPRFLFARQLHLFPDDVEIRIVAIQAKARTAGDVVVVLPGERVMAAGDLFYSTGYPIIDRESGGGTAVGWIEGLKQAFDAMPLLKSAMPQPKPDPSLPPEEEKTMEELIPVIPAHGPATNLQQMKDLLTAAQKLRADASRAVKIGRSRESFLRSLPREALDADPNLETFAGLLYDELSAPKVK